MPSSHLILCRPLFLLLPVPPSIRDFSIESTLCMRWPKHWSFSFSISPSKEHPALISFRMDWLDLLAVQETLRVFSNTTVQKHQFFGTQLSFFLFFFFLVVLLFFNIYPQGGEAQPPTPSSNLLPGGQDGKRKQEKHGFTVEKADKYHPKPSDQGQHQL